MSPELSIEFWLAGPNRGQLVVASRKHYCRLLAIIHLLLLGEQCLLCTMGWGGVLTT
jgi:hypothetical protein